MKKLLVALLMLALMIPTLTCAAAQAESSPTDRILADWTSIAYVYDDIYSQQNFTFDLIVAFASEPTWDNLVRARAAASFTCELMDYYAQYELEPFATNDDYAQLTAQGMDVTDTQATVNAFMSQQSVQQRLQDSLIWRSYYMAELMEGAHTADWVSALALNSSGLAAYNDLNLQYWFLTNNFLLLQLPDADATDLAEWSYQYLPAIMSSCPELLETENDVLNQLNDTIEGMNENMLILNSALAMSQDSLDEFASDPVMPDMLEISGLPRVLPLPASTGIELDDVTYYWQDDAGDITTLNRMMEYDELPNCMDMRFASCTLADYQKYVLELTGYEVELVDMNDTAALFDVDGASLTVWFDPDAQTIDIYVSDGQICFAPNYYAQLLNETAA